MNNANCSAIPVYSKVSPTEFSGTDPQVNVSRTAVKGKEKYLKVKGYDERKINS